MNRSCALWILALVAGTAQAEELPRTFEVTARSGLNVRDTPDGDKVDALRWGTWIDVLERDGEWARIGDGRYVHADHLRPAADRLVGTHTLAGQDSERGDYTVTLTLTAADDGLSILRAARYGDVEETQVGAGRVVGGWLTAELGAQSGAANAVAGEAASDALSLRFRRAPDGAYELEESSARGEGTARKAPPAPQPSSGGGSGGNSPSPRGPHLIAVHESKVQSRISQLAGQAVIDGFGLKNEFELTNFLHVGVGGEVEAIVDSRLTPAQAEQRSAHPRHVWLESKVHGGVRVPLDTTIPMGNVAVKLGFEAGARVDYTVVDLYPVPAGITDGRTIAQNLKRMASRSFDLPLSHREARAMTPGAKRIMEGRAHVAVSGELQLGFDGSSTPVRAEATVRAGGFYRVSGRARIEVERLRRDSVRVRLSTAKTHERGVTAEAVLRAAIDEGVLREELEPAVDYIDEALIDANRLTPEQRAAVLTLAEDAMVKAGNSIVRRLTRFRLRGTASIANERTFDLAYRFDLNGADARRAYDRAVRGDFTLAGRLSRQPGSGVVRDHRAVGFERRRQLRGDLSLSVFLNARVTRTIAVGALVVDDAQGRTRYDYWRYDYEFKLEVFNRDRKRKIHTEIVRRTRGHDVQRTLRFRVEIQNPSTWARVAHGTRRQFYGWGLDASSSYPQQSDDFLRSAYGNSTTIVELQIGDSGLNRVLQQGYREFFRSYAREVEAYTGEAPAWNTEAAIQATAKSMNNLESRIPGIDEDEAQELKRCGEFARHLYFLANEPTARQRERALSWIANSAKRDLYAVGALIRLTDPAQRTLDASIIGRNLRVVDSQQGARAIDVFQAQ